MNFGFMIQLDNMKKYFLFLYLFILQSVCYSQLLDNKINLYFCYGNGIYHGKQYIQKNSFIYPSLYNNFQNIENKSIKGVIQKNKYLCIGISAEILTAKNWLLDNNFYFTSSYIYQHSISPIIQFHNKFAKTGTLNRYKFYAGINPKIGLSNFQLIDHIIHIEKNSQEITPPSTTINLLLGLSTTAGIEIKVKQFLGIFLEYSLNYGFAKSNLFLDNDFLNSQINFGLFFRLKKDKLFFY